MKHLLYAGAIVLVALTLKPQAAQARPEAPWCAVINLGFGDVYWDCQYNSIEECRPNVLAGNRGFCNPNPRYDGWYRQAEKPHSRHKRRVKHY